MENYSILLKKLRKLLKKYNYKIIKRKTKHGNYILTYENKNYSRSYWVYYYHNLEDMFSILFDDIRRNKDVISNVYFDTNDFELINVIETIYSKSIEEMILKLQLLGY